MRTSLRQLFFVLTIICGCTTIAHHKLKIPTRYTINFKDENGRWSSGTHGATEDEFSIDNDGNLTYTWDPLFGDDFTKTYSKDRYTIEQIDNPEDFLSPDDVRHRFHALFH